MGYRVWGTAQKTTKFTKKQRFLRCLYPIPYTLPALHFAGEPCEARVNIELIMHFLYYKQTQTLTRREL
jgi:hypothetical protein